MLNYLKITQHHRLFIFVKLKTVILPLSMNSTSMNNNYLIIMAGGIGSRFWPMSTTASPKQFHDVLGTGKTLIQQTYERFEGICPNENIFVVTNEQYKTLVQEQLPFLNSHQILTEPHRKNTAPCVAYASYKIKSKNPNANLVVSPADHLVLKEEEFKETIHTAIAQAQAENCLVTLGIKPSRPDTGYGYIQFVDAKNVSNSSVKRVKTFTEKPEKDLAKQFIKSGDFYWNSGIFIWSVNAIIDSFEKHLPEEAKLFEEGADVYFTEKEDAFIKSIYPQAKNISIDFGIMEKANNVYVVLSDFGWSDLGTWGSLYTHIPHDEHKNAILGNNVRVYDSSKNMIKLPDDKLAIIHGLDGYIVVESNNTLLICKKEDEQKIKDFVADLKAEKKSKFV
jgi:mannose-1-phosphate guanylyltransferase